jgi:signal transduction histidine kinase
MSYFSLKTKLAFYSLLVFVTLVPGTVYFSLGYFRNHYEQSIVDHQVSLVNQLVQEIDSKLVLAQSLLGRVGSLVTPEIIASPAHAERFLDNRVGALSVFDNGLFLFTPDGRIIAETLTKPSRTGFDLSFRDYIRCTASSRRPCISAPFVSSQSHQHPIIMLTIPLLDEKGELLGIFGGSLDLMKPNFLGAIAEQHFGTSGYFSLVTMDGLVVAHHDRQRILGECRKDTDSVHHLVLQAPEGSGMVKNMDGVALLSTFKRLSATDWYVSANRPVDEAFDPVRKATVTAWMIVGIGALVTALAFWFGMGRFIAPLERMTLQVRETSAGGELRRVEVDSRDEIGELAGVFNGMMAELSADREELERRVAERTKELQTAVNELSSFCYSVSHDLRAPVRNLNGLCHVLLEDCGDGLDDRGKALLQRIMRACTGMGERIDDLLNLARVSRHELLVADVDLSAMARAIAAELSAGAPERQVEFVIADGLRARGDAGLLWIALENLLGNAWKFTGKREEGVIEFGRTTLDGREAFFVRDNGAGFGKEYAGNLFVPFQRLHGAEEFEGTGIGLATVQRIIQRHGGTIRGEGAEGEGATFTFAIP